jgi:hypothetical protein
MLGIYHWNTNQILFRPLHVALLESLRQINASRDLSLVLSSRLINRKNKVLQILISPKTLLLSNIESGKCHVCYIYHRLCHQTLAGGPRRFLQYTKKDVGTTEMIFKMQTNLRFVHSTLNPEGSQLVK